ncbi:MAG: four helix bundle protein [Saprospiraceae bacterium]
MMSNEEFATRFKTRTKQFVIRSTNLFRALPNTEEARIFGKQYLRAASSVGANYRAACRARSAEEFFSKINIVVEEADEACFWMEVIIETNLLPENKVAALLKEAKEITAVAAAARFNTPSKSNKNYKKNK